jgi:hypothetical protein
LVLSNIFTITSTLDDGSTGTLRWAFNQVNNDATDTAADPDRIQFDIPQSDPGFSAGVWTIQPLTQLPTILKPVVIDGYTQAGSQPNTNGPSQGDNATLTIAVSGSKQLGGNGDGIVIDTPGATVRGLIVELYTNSIIGVGIAIGNNDVVEGCFIGTDNHSTAGIGNDIGIVCRSSSTIGGTTAAARNVISGNPAASGTAGGIGIMIRGNENIVEGNLIGTDLAGTSPLGNPFTGIAIEGLPGTVYEGASNTIGGTSAAARNVIAATDGSGIYLTGFTVAANVVEGNYIGTNVTGTAKISNGTPSTPNQSRGVSMVGTGAIANTIGGTVAGAGNLISGNGEGVFAQNYAVIEGNLIGTDVTGLTALGNGIGVGLDESFNTVGGTIAAARNVISGNEDYGIVASSIDVGGADPAAHIVIEGNFIGTDAMGLKALPNQIGVVLDGARDSTIGGTASGASNLIAGNTGAGILLSATARRFRTSGNVIARNLIGTDLTGLQPLGNGASGVLLGQAAAFPTLGTVVQNTIGGTTAGAGNRIAFNQAAGVTVVLDTTTGNAIEGNSIFENAKLGIDLGGTGVPLQNTPGGPHVGPNDLQNTPVLQSVSFAGGNTQITATLNSIPGTVFRIEFFRSPTPDPSGFGQGKTFLGAIDVATNSSGNTGPFTFTTTGELTDVILSGTATDPNGNTSEFARDIQTPAQGPSVELSARPNPSLFGRAVILTAFLPSEPTPGSPGTAPTGTVTFLVDGKALEPPAVLRPVGGVSSGSRAVFTAPVLAAGTHRVTAHYNGGNFPTADSQPVFLRIRAVSSEVRLTSAPDPSQLGQPVTFTATVTGATAPTPGGFVDFRDGTTTLGRVLIGARGQAQFTTSALATGSHSIVAFYEGDRSHTPSRSSALVQNVLLAGPIVVSVQRFGFHTQPTVVVLTFSEPLAPATAQDVRNYQITGPGGVPILLSSATYDAVNHSVALRPSQQLSLYLRYTLTVIGDTPGGVTDAYGNLLDGAGTGHPGSNFVTFLNAHDLVFGGLFVRGPARPGHPNRRK